MVMSYPIFPTAPAVFPSVIGKSQLVSQGLVLTIRSQTNPILAINNDLWGARTSRAIECIKSLPLNLCRPFYKFRIAALLLGINRFIVFIIKSVLTKT